MNNCIHFAQPAFKHNKQWNGMAEDYARKYELVRFYSVDFFLAFLDQLTNKNITGFLSNSALSTQICQLQIWLENLLNTKAYLNINPINTGLKLKYQVRGALGVVRDMTRRVSWTNRILLYDQLRLFKDTNKKMKHQHFSLVLVSFGALLRVPRWSSPAFLVGWISEGKKMGFSLRQASLEGAP